MTRDKGQGRREKGQGRRDKGEGKREKGKIENSLFPFSLVPS
jgi:hypothetical protein